ncbi:MAG: hypothetical protein ACFB51_05840 [Anaerolineae bacterium]
MRRVFALALLLLASCQTTAPQATDEPIAAPAPTTIPQETATMPPTPRPPAEEPVYGLTYLRLDGNRIMDGRGGMPGANRLEIPLGGQAEWIVGAPQGEGSLWAVVLTDGRVEAFRVAGENIEPAALNVDRVQPGQPPLLRVSGNQAEIVVLPGLSPLTHPVPVGDGFAGISQGGELVRFDAAGSEVDRLAVNALPDARILVDEQERLLLLTGPTEAYRHNVLGDAVEAGGFTLVDSGSGDLAPLLTVETQGTVIEGIAPLWADFDKDGTREIIVTEANDAQGAGVVVYREDGSVLASGPVIGQGFRWRHQLAVATFDEQPALVEVRTPHIGGQVGFFTLQGDSLVGSGFVLNYTSHVIQTRNLDMAAAGDFDGDGRIEIVMPDQQRSQLAGIVVEEGEGEVVWSVETADRVITNVHAVRLASGDLVLAAGNAGNVLELWYP